MSAGGTPVDRVDPAVGDTLRVDGLDWEVTDHSSYWNDGGYRVTEWECQAGAETGYLLKEVADTGAPRWLFTRQVQTAEVTVPGGPGVADHAARAGRGKPPAQVRCRGESYTHAETTEGTYEEEPGEREAKATWDYWDTARGRNLAVEVWADGRVDCYLGRYIEPAEAVVLGAEAEVEGLEASTGSSVAGPAAALAAAGTLGVGRSPARAAAPATAGAGGAPAEPRRGAGAKAGKPTAPTRPFRVAAVVLPVAYVVPFVLGWPFDRAMTVALSAALGLAWLASLAELPLTGLAALLVGPALALGFWRYPPLGSVIGVTLLVAAPAAIAGLARARGGRRAPGSARFLAGFSVAAPLTGLGIFHYTAFAPAPHSVSQWLLALGPAAIGLLAGLVIAALVVRPDAQP